MNFSQFVRGFAATVKKVTIYSLFAVLFQINQAGVGRKSTLLKIQLRLGAQNMECLHPVTLTAVHSLLPIQQVSQANLMFFWISYDSAAIFWGVWKTLRWKVSTKKALSCYVSLIQWHATVMQAWFSVSCMTGENQRQENPSGRNAIEGESVTSTM